jgi:GxxExxY protein
MQPVSRSVYPQMTQIQDVPESERDPRTYRIIGAAIEVHQHLGPGFLEAVYQEVLAIEFVCRAIPHRPQVEIPIWYKGQLLQCAYRADFICFGEVVVEIKGIRALGGTEEAQIIHYLKATGLHTGLLLNFGGAWLEHRRFAHTPSA